MGLVEDVWYGDGLAAGMARLALWPLSVAFGAVSAARTALYDANILHAEAPLVKTLSVGNLTVGGTGKTPVAAWLAERLSHAARTTVVLRGYGDDEAEVHRRLNPHVPVIVGADRAAAIRTARERGTEVVVLDDAFQHRRVQRQADIVLVSAEQLARRRRLLPAGPWREPLSAARRADLLIITRKSATMDDVRRGLDLLRTVAPSAGVATVHLAPLALVNAADATTLPIERLRGAPVVAIAAIGEPGAFQDQLGQLGARVTMRAFRDHHAFTDDEIRALAALVPADGFAVCTLKDAVKLAHRWPGPSRLWYVSQQLFVEQGGGEIDRLLQRVLDAPTTTTITAG